MIITYSIQEENLVGQVLEQRENYDLLIAIVISLEREMKMILNKVIGCGVVFEKRGGR